MATQLKKVLTPTMLWGLGVGYVISGMYFGWNLGLKEAGTLGMAMATFIIIIMYVAFSFSYSELACSIPKAGGAFDYANKALGADWGFIAGMVQMVEFIFAPPAIALGIGAYFNLFFPDIPVIAFAVGAYLIFTAFNIYGVAASASFELLITFAALAGLFLFAAVSIPHFKTENLQINAFPNGWHGTFAAIPFAIWFFLGIEGVANVAEETINPQKDITKGFGLAILTLVVVCIMTFIFSIGINGWETIVLNKNTGKLSDSPLPLALLKITTEGSLIYKSIVAMGTLGLVASFNGLLLSAGRATFELGRVGYAPPILGKIHSKFRTPHIALITNMFIGIGAIFTGQTSNIITIAVFGALLLYIISMISLIAYRQKEPNAIRPFKVPLYPFTPIVALVIATFCLICLTYYHSLQAFVFIFLLIIAYFLFKILVKLPSEVYAERLED